MFRIPTVSGISGLLLALALGTSARHADAIGPGSRVRLTLLALPGGGTPDVAGARALAVALRQRTHIAMARKVKSLGPLQPDLLRHPLLVTTAAGALPKLDAPAVARLRRHLTRGGTWILDGPADRAKQPAFQRAARRVVQRILPRARLQALAGDHTLFKSFYLLSPVTFNAIGRPILGVRRDGRSPVLVVHGLLSALKENGHSRRRELQIRLGINLVMYALCVDYKSDQVHAPAIMRRRRWQAR